MGEHWRCTPVGVRTAIIAAIMCGLAWCAWWEFTRAHVYRQAVSPDGSWAATVFWHRVPPYIEGLDLDLVVNDGAGHVLHRERIAAGLDIWQDVETKYSDFSVENERIRVGPYFWEKNLTRMDWQ